MFDLNAPDTQMAPQVRAYDILSLRRALALEIKTGIALRRGVNLVTVAKKRGYVTPNTRTKKAALEQMDALADKVLGNAA